MARLSRIVQAGAEHDPIGIDFKDDFVEYDDGPLACIKAKAVNPSYDVFMAVIPGVVLYELYEEFGSRLLELNVRSFLQVTGNVNRGIKKTLHSEPSMFLPYNNGISATADSVELEQRDGGLFISKMTGLQIVNGGQTMASIHRARKTDRVSIDDVLVQAKITCIRRMDQSEVDDLVRKISLYANTQNKVNAADFSANDPFHVQLEKLANTVYVPGEQSRWFYERSRGSYQTAKARYCISSAKKRDFERLLPAQQKLTKTDLAKYSASWEQLPHFVSRGNQKNFVRFMSSLKDAHGKKWLPDVDYYRHLIATAILFRRTERIVRDEGFPAYRANVVAYTVALVSHRCGEAFNLSRIWQLQTISSDLSELLRHASRAVYERITESADGRNVTEWCKKEECWTTVKALSIDIPDGLPELSASPSPSHDGDGISRESSSEKDQGLSIDEILVLARVMDVAAETWQELARWGQATRHLTDAQVRLAARLRDQAHDGWQKTPTPSQAKRAAFVLASAERHVGPVDTFHFDDTDWTQTGQA